VPTFAVATDRTSRTKQGTIAGPLIIVPKVDVYGYYNDGTKNSLILLDEWMG
jgi:hypothetical protein